VNADNDVNKAEELKGPNKRGGFKGANTPNKLAFYLKQEHD